PTFARTGAEAKELIAIMGSLRETTDESASSVANSLKSIFARLQKPAVNSNLASLGINLRDSNGDALSAFEQVRRLSEATSGLSPNSARFASIAGELGGARNLQTITALIKNFDDAQQHLNASQAGAAELEKNQGLALDGLGSKLSRTRESLQALTRQT